MNDPVDKDKSGGPLVSAKVFDLAGLGEPLQKLVEYWCKGMGVLWNPTQQRREAKAAADSIRTIANAAVDVQHLPLQFNYAGKTVQIWSDGPGSSTRPLSLEDRAGQRLVYKALKGQQNIEAVLGVAAREIENEQDVPDEPPDEDWARRFFNYAEDVSSEQMRHLWGRILAGKVKRPASYSLRTLDFLRSMSGSEAVLFEKFAAHAISDDSGQVFILSSLISKDDEPLSFLDALTLGEIGLINEASSVSLNIEIAPGGSILLHLGSQTMCLTASDKGFNKRIAARLFTLVGRELINLAEKKKQPANVKALVPFFHERSVHVVVGDYLSITADGQSTIENATHYTDEMVEKLKTG